VRDAAVAEHVDEVGCTGATTGIVDRTTIGTNAREIITYTPDVGMYLLMWVPVMDVRVMWM
jgi:hypothetical protein